MMIIRWCYVQKKRILTEYDVTNIWGPQTRKNMITMGNLDISDLMMTMMTRATDIPVQSPELKYIDAYMGR